jgi:hypothetical protein
MSKQSRAKSRRHHKKPTGAVATFEQQIRYMSEDRLYKMLGEAMNELHKALCDRRTFKDNKFLSMFYLREWDDLEREVALKNSASDNRTKALEIIPKVKNLFDRIGDKNMNV